MPRKNSFALRTEIDRLLNSKDERERLGAAARESVKNFSIAKQGERVAAFMENRLNAEYDITRVVSRS